MASTSVVPSNNLALGLPPLRLRSKACLGFPVKTRAGASAPAAVSTSAVVASPASRVGSKAPAWAPLAFLGGLQRANEGRKEEVAEEAGEGQERGHTPGLMFSLAPHMPASLSVPLPRILPVSLSIGFPLLNLSGPCLSVGLPLPRSFALSFSIPLDSDTANDWAATPTVDVALGKHNTRLPVPFSLPVSPLLHSLPFHLPHHLLHSIPFHFTVPLSTAALAFPS